MLEVYVALNAFLILILLNKRIKIIKHQNYLSIFDGLFFGGIFFILTPICYSFVIGQISTVGLPNFEPHKDYKLVLYAVSSVTFFGFSTVMFSKNKRCYNTQIRDYEKIFFSLTLILYFLALIISFISSGKLSGGSHWYRANEDLFEKSSFYVLLGQMHNVGRVVIPGLCLYFQLNFLNKGKYFKPHFIIAAIVVVFELFLAGNRIVLLFFIFSIVIPLIVYKKYKRLIYIAMFCMPLIIVAKFWPMVRGMIWAEQVSIERVIDVMSIAYQSEIISDDGESDPILVLTEGSNIVSLKYVIDNFPRKYDYTYGDTMILKSLGALIPKSIWPSKPDGIGNLVGEVALSGVSLYLNVTILGDAWSNFSWLGIFYIIIMLVFVQNFFKLKYFKLLTSIFFMVAIASWRFDFSFYFITIYILFFYFFLMKVTPIRKSCSKLSNVIFK